MTPNRPVPACGPRTAKIVIVGEAPCAEETLRQQPFVGASGQELTKMLHEAGISRTECFITNVCPYQPPGNNINAFFLDGEAREQPGPLIQEGIERLRNDLAEIQPNVVIALGDVALRVLTGMSGITSWRGSVMQCAFDPTLKVVPTIHPAAILRMWEWRHVAVNDLRRARAESEYREIRWPEWYFELSPSFDAIQSRLAYLLDLAARGPLKLAVDIETIRHCIACVGIAWSPNHAICIPFRTRAEFWSPEEELAIVLTLRELLTHENVRVVGQNFLYDAQYFARYFGFVPRLTDDTMFQQHVLLAGEPKDLAYLASLYCEFYQYWKDDLKDYRVAPTDDAKFFRYNCIDCVRTYEISERLATLISNADLDSVYSFQIGLWHSALNMMLRGVRVDKAARSKLAVDLMQAAAEREKFIVDVVGYSLNPRSSKQMKQFLYEEMGLPQITNRKTGKVTANFEALQSLSKKYPLIAPIADCLLEMRSIGTFLSTFIQSELDTDGRMRASFNPAGPETYRLSSSTNAFGSGMNMQNIPSGDRQKTKMKLPNVRSLFIPDVGKEIADMDLDRADLQVVVWESNDAQLKRALREGVDLHLLNAKALFNLPFSFEDLLAKDKLAKIKETYSVERQIAKQFVHGTNYGGSAQTMAAVCNISVAQAKLCQNNWFREHPGIKAWHDRIRMQLQTRRMITNRFGYRRIYFGRVESLLSEALAWIPQSTVACVINRAWRNIETNVPECEILVQVHDSLVFQYPVDKTDEVLRKVHENSLITVPYPDPLVIPVGLKTSRKSWGEATPRSWPK